MENPVDIVCFYYEMKNSFYQVEEGLSLPVVDDK